MAYSDFSSIKYGKHKFIYLLILLHFAKVEKTTKKIGVNLPTVSHLLT